MAEDDDRDRGDSRPHGEDSGERSDAEDGPDAGRSDSRPDAGNPEGRPDGEDPDAVDAAFDALADERRRLALYYLRDRESADLGELATVVSGWRQARAPEDGRVTPDDRDRTRIALHHVHLPRLADGGFVRYDADDREVALDRVPDVLDSVLEQSLADDRRGVEPFGRGGEPTDGRGSSDDGESTDDLGSSDDEKSDDGDDPGSTGDGSESGGDGT